MKGGKLKLTFNTALIAILVVIFGFIVAVRPVFISSSYLLNVVLRNVIEIGLIALPMTLTIITGGIDLSVGNIMILSAMLGSVAASACGNAVGVIVTIGIGLACGLLNGIIIAKVRVPAMVTTLASMFLFLGITRGVTGGDSVYAYPAAKTMGGMSLMEIPLQIFLYIIVAVIFVILLSKSTFGRKIYGIGLNDNAVRYAGINSERIIIITYMLNGLLCAVSGLILLGRFTSLRFDAGTNVNLKVITIVVLGGTSILGGVGDMKGTVIATMIIATLNSGLTVLNIPIDMQTIVQGVVLMISLIAYELVNRRMKTKKIRLMKDALTH